MFDRRDVLKSTGRAALGLAAGMIMGVRPGWAEETATLPFANGQRPMAAYPGKRAMIVQTARPPQLETPFSVFNEGIITPNDVFFVRYHLADIPLSIDPNNYAIEIKGKVA